MDNIITRVSKMFNDRYGAQLRIESKQGVSGSNISNHWPSAFVYSRTLRQVSFPIFDSSKNLKAVATASPVENKDAVVFDEMAQFIQLTIADHIDLKDRNDILIGQERALEQEDIEPGKVVPLRTRKKSDYQYVEYKKPKPKGEIDLKPIWIHGDDKAMNAQIAFAVHDWVGNWAFINATEIPDLIWEDEQGWQNFPQVTLFIPGGEDLNEEKVNCIHRNLDRLKHQKGPKPLIVITSTGQLSPEIEAVRRCFKNYKTHKNLTPKIQAHFLLFHQENQSPWVHKDQSTNGVYFLPFSLNPKSFH